VNPASDTLLIVFTTVVILVLMGTYILYLKAQEEVRKVIWIQSIKNFNRKKIEKREILIPCSESSKLKSIQETSHSILYYRILERPLWFNLRRINKKLNGFI